MLNKEKTMRALILSSFGEDLVLSDIVMPAVKEGQVLVQIKASGVNPLDTKIRAGQAAHAQVKLPAILGIDLAGIVVEVGEGVTGFKPGDEVYGMTGGVGDNQGSLAEYAAVDARLLAIKPKNMTMRQAAAIPLIFITAWEGLVDRAQVHGSQKVLVQGGAGGVGHMAVQLAKAFGAEVFATESLIRKEMVESLGAAFIDKQASATEDILKEFNIGEGFDIVYDTAGGPTLDASFKLAKTYTGHVVSCLGWGNHALAPLSFRGATYSGVFTLLPLLTEKGRTHHGEILTEATRLIEAGKLEVILDPHIYTLETAMHAYKAIENRTANGKLVVTIAE
jgi:NADPH:quinone reductase-like Zn-dependent oxidoreductase